MRIRVAHCSMQAGDNDKQQLADVEKLFRRAATRKYAWLTGTEAGPGSNNLPKHLVQTARRFGFRPWVPSLQGEGIERHTGTWLAVRKDLIAGDWEKDFILGIKGSEQLRDEMHIPKNKKWGPRGLTYASFQSTNPDLGGVSIGVSHYLTQARSPKSPYWALNKQLAGVIGDWAKEKGRGHDLVFYAGDQNMLDVRNDQPQGDTFFGEDLTSTWDELRHWENTGHGNIDVIATYNKDGRVEALKTHVLDDREFHLHTDHFLVEAVLKVAPRRK